jgi:hypothetical protein
LSARTATPEPEPRRFQESLERGSAYWVLGMECGGRGIWQDWHWLDMQLSLGFALLVAGYGLMHGIYAWVALTRNKPLLLMA